MMVFKKQYTEAGYHFVIARWTGESDLQEIGNPFNYGINILEAAVNSP